MVILGIISTVIRALLRTITTTTDPYLDNVVLSLRMESSDPYYNQKVLGLHCDGANNSTTFTDVKGNTVTANADAKISTAQYPSLTGKSSSGYLDGTGDYLSVPASSDWDFGAGDYTIKFLIRFSTVPGAGQYACLMDNRNSSGTDMQFAMWYGGTEKWYLNYTTDGSTQISSSGISSHTPSVDTWYEVAWVRSGTSLKVYIDGIGSTSHNIGTSTLFNSGSALNIGRSATNQYYVHGYYSEIQIYKGVALHTKNYSIASAPFPEPANTAIDDTGKTVTTVGGAQFSGFSKYGSGSFYFDGNGDYLTVPDDAAWVLGNNDFTIEAWIYLTGYAANNGGNYQATIISQDISSTRAFMLGIEGTVSTYASLFFVGFSNNTTYTVVTNSATISLNTWYHVAATRNGNLVYLFLNGTLLNSGGTSFSENIQDAATTLKIGAREYDATYKYYFPGYIDDLRITKGVARYTSNFTPYKILTTAPAGDPLYNYTTLLLKMNGTNGGTTFTDNSYSPKTITVNGNTNTSTAQLKYGTASGYFDGTGDYLTTPYSSDFNFGARDFTIELWLYKTANNANGSRIWNANGDYYHQVEIGINASGNLICYMTSNGTSWNLVSASNIATLSNNTWYHIAIVRNGGTALAFINGTIYTLSSGLSTTALVNGTNGSTTRSIGGQAGIDRPFAGYIDDFRITNGFARYTAAFQPPGPHIAAIDPDTDQWWLNTVLAMRMDGTHGSTTFTDLKGKTVTPYGNTSISSAVSKFGQAAYFDGTGDYLSVPDSEEWSFGTGDFTVEAWVRFDSSNPAVQTICSQFDTSSNWWLFRKEDNTTNKLSLYFIIGGTVKAHYIMTSSWSSWAADTWYHLAMVRSGTSMYIFIDGASQTLTATVSVSTNDMGNIASPLYIGSDTTYDLKGYIDDLRITKGVARYTTTFTPSEKPLPTYVVGPDHDQYWDKVVLACPFDTSLNDTRTKATTAYGNAAVSSAQKKFGDGSANFDGTGDYITYPDSADWDFTTSFTIEFWCYVTAFDTDGALFIMQQSGATYGGFEFFADQYGTLYFRRSDAILVVTSATGILTAGSWKHLAATWDGTTYRVFVDGIIVGSGSSASAPANVTGVLRIGTYVGASTYDLNGYIDDLRITKGVARYTADFELPTVANILG